MNLFKHNSTRLFGRHSIKYTYKVDIMRGPSQHIFEITCARSHTFYGVACGRRMCTPGLLANKNSMTLKQTDRHTSFCAFGGGFPPAIR